MSRWVRGIYNAAANFVLSGSLRAASGRTMDRDTKHLRQESDKPNQSGESCQPSKSCGPTATTCSCTGTCTCSTARATTCSGSTASSAKDGKLPNNHGDSCTCSLCRDYADYISATGSGTIRTEGQGSGSRIRFSHEPRHTKQADGNAATTIEHITGIPTGVTL